MTIWQHDDEVSLTPCLYSHTPLVSQATPAPRSPSPFPSIMVIRGVGPLAAVGGFPARLSCTVCVEQIRCPFSLFNLHNRTGHAGVVDLCYALVPLYLAPSSHALQSLGQHDAGSSGLLHSTATFTNFTETKLRVANKDHVCASTGHGILHNQAGCMRVAW